MQDELVHLLLHHVPIGIGVWDAADAATPNDMKLIFVNEWGFTNLMTRLGIVSRDVIGLTVQQVIDKHGAEPNKKFIQALFETAQSQSPREVEIGEIQGRIYRMYFLPMGTRVAASMFEDVTEAKEVNERLLLALESAKAGMWWFDYVDGVQSWDPGIGMMLGMGSAGTAPGVALDDFISKVASNDAQSTRALIERALANPQIKNVELEFSISRGDGRTTTVMDRAQIYRDETGKVVQMMHVLIDIDDKVQLMKQLQQSNTDLKNFAHVASHDLREPLRVISNYTQLLFDEYGERLAGSAEAMEYRKFIEEAAWRAMSLVDDLLRFSRAGNNMNAQENVSLSRLAQIATENLRVAIDEAKAVVLIDPLPSVTCDAGMMVQVFQNLLSNAVKFSKKDGTPTIHVTAMDVGQRWLIAVQDDGIGIEPEFLSRIFTPFYRLYPTEEYEGTGIGLALCQRIVRAHKGEIWAESSGRGQGTTLFFTLPKAA